MGHAEIGGNFFGSIFSFLLDGRKNTLNYTAIICEINDLCMALEQKGDKFYNFPEYRALVDRRSKLMKEQVKEYEREKTENCRGT